MSQTKTFPTDSAIDYFIVSFHMQLNGLNITFGLPKVKLHNKDSVFSSPEPLGSQGELIGWP